MFRINPGTDTSGNSVAKRYVCKHCHVTVVSKTNHRPILGREHGKSCPRKNK